MDEEASLGVIDLLPRRRAFGSFEDVGARLYRWTRQHHRMVAFVSQRESELHLAWHSGPHLDTFQGKRGKEHRQAARAQLNSLVRIER